jgi:hypothetical protein
MSSAKLAVACGLAAVALSACGSSAKPAAGTLKPSTKPAGRGKVDDPRTLPNHIQCLRDHNVPLTLIGATKIQIGTYPSGPTVQFEPTPGIAEGDQMRGTVNAAEVIGNALLYPNQASDQLLKTVEDCVAQGVPG